MNCSGLVKVKSQRQAPPLDEQWPRNGAEVSRGWGGEARKGWAELRNPPQLSSSSTQTHSFSKKSLMPSAAATGRVRGPEIELTPDLERPQPPWVGTRGRWKGRWGLTPANEGRQRHQKWRTPERTEVWDEAGVWPGPAPTTGSSLRALRMQEGLAMVLPHLPPTRD